MSCTVSDFARRVGLSRQAVARAIHDGRIVSAWKVGDRWRLDAAAAARELEANSCPGRARNSGRAGLRAPGVALGELVDLAALDAAADAALAALPELPEPDPSWELAVDWELIDRVMANWCLPELPAG